MCSLLKTWDTVKEKLQLFFTNAVSLSFWNTLTDSFFGLLFDSLSFRKGTERLTNLCLFKFIYWSALGQYRSQKTQQLPGHVNISPAQLVWNWSYTQPYQGNSVLSPRSIQVQFCLQNTSLPVTVSLEVNLKPQKLYITHLNFYFFKQQLKKTLKTLLSRLFLAHI